MTDAPRPNVARIYDYLLGGSSNFPVDRAAADEVVRLQPLAARSVRENRDFLVRAGGGFSCPGQHPRAPAIQKLLAFSQPVGLFLVSILHFIPDVDWPHELVRRYLSALPPGSHLVLSHASVPARAVRTGQAMREYNARTDGALTLRPPEQIRAFFDGLRILAPGVVNVACWRPGPRPSAADTGAYDETEGGYLGGVGRLA
jgi:hypothetical protein